MVAQIDKKFMRARPSKLWSRLVAYTLFEGRPLTTRGRWINTVVFACYRLWAVLPLRTRDVAPVFILGVGRSGTTILGTILGLHRDVGYLNEPKALWQAALGDDDLLGSYSAAPGRYRMDHSDASPAKSKRLHRFYRAFQNLSFSRRVVDKYPELLFRMQFLDEVFPGSRKILLLRDGADTCQSIAHWSEKNAADAADWWGRDGQKWRLLVDQLVAQDKAFAGILPQIRALTRHTDMAAVEWIVTMREVLRLVEEDPDGLKVVKYEDLARDPERVISDLLDFCSLPADAAMMGYARAVLRPRDAYGAPILDPAIRQLFNDTMLRLGYRAHPA